MCKKWSITYVQDFQLAVLLKKGLTKQERLTIAWSFWMTGTSKNHKIVCNSLTKLDVCRLLSVRYRISLKIKVCAHYPKDDMIKHKALSEKLNFANMHFLNEKINNTLVSSKSFLGLAVSKVTFKTGILDLLSITAYF